MSELDELRKEFAEMQQRLVEQSGALQQARTEQKETLSWAKAVFEQQVTAQETPPAVYIPRDHKLPEFSGCSTKSGDITIEEWVSAMKSAFKVLKVPDEDRIELVEQQLKDEAKLIVRFKVTFGTRLKEFYERKQMSGETVRSYAYDLRKKLNRVVQKDSDRVPDAAAVLKEQLVLSLKDDFVRREMKRRVKEEKDLSFTQLMQAAITWSEEEEVQAPCSVKNSAHSTGIVNAAAATANSSPALTLETLHEAIQKIAAHQEELYQVVHGQGKAKFQQRRFRRALLKDSEGRNPRCGILVVKDPPGASSAVPGVLGMNVISRCYQELFGLHGPSLFSLPLVAQAPGPVVEALQQCHQFAAHVPIDPMGAIRVRGTRALCIPGGVMKLVASTCPELCFGRSALFDPPEAGLPAGLLASPCLVQVARGTVYVPVVNVGTTEDLLHLRTCLGSLSSVQVVSLPTGITEVWSTTATVSSQVAARSAQSGIEAVDLSALTDQEQQEVRSLLQKYSSVFSAHEGDLGCTNLIEHEIPLLDNVLVRQRYRRIPPSEYELRLEIVLGRLKKERHVSIYQVSGNSSLDIRSLQESDPLLKEVLVFWRKQVRPSPPERRQDPVPGGIQDWVLEHQARLKLAFEGARERLLLAAGRRKERHDQRVRDEPLQEVVANDTSSDGDPWLLVSETRPPAAFVQVVLRLQGLLPVEDRPVLEAPAEQGRSQPLDYSLLPVDQPCPSLSLLRLTARSTAGQHSKVHHLPRSVGGGDAAGWTRELWARAEADGIGCGTPLTRPVVRALLGVIEVCLVVTCDHIKPTVRVEPQSSVYTGDTVTLTCELPPPPDWLIYWKKDSQHINPPQNTYSLTVSDPGEYQCGASRGDVYTEYSDPVRITVGDLPSSGAPVSVLSVLSSAMAVSPYLLVSIVLGVKCYRARAKVGKKKDVSAAEKQQIVECLGQGMTTINIAKKLHRDHRTIKKRMWNGLPTITDYKGDMICDMNVSPLLAGRPQVVRVGNSFSSTLTLRTGSTQGCVFSPLLYSLFTYDSVARHTSNTIFKFADDTIILGLITDGDKTTETRVNYTAKPNVATYYSCNSTLPLSFCKRM
ncbi:hypothetical protein NFI96_002857 [Prochilodus magdalenae]|nr:hypothetical protein NFI96_002857 [Prochilodus magdalenae]